ncbi:hypothetical protein ATN84_25670 [Paramesorhizobium deserti]|uniref:Integrase catalytic domain-containing protein n=1 Tax=Paramesorhizobium deserti TaxID=1494590 RepID=A0A135HTM3_9HYPH|nr:hypothetical protein ATN84_25670 [Paramesorhizobium deserti]
MWAMDFVHDQLATGKKLRVLTVVDTFSRYVPVLDPRFIDPDHLTHRRILLVVHPFAPSVIVEAAVNSESAKDSLRYQPLIFRAGPICCRF